MSWQARFGASQRSRRERLPIAVQSAEGTEPDPDGVLP
jgi:hypothetical protein